MENEKTVPFSSDSSDAAVSADYSGTMCDAALSYARNGRAVFPLAEGEKRPLTPHGSHDATTSEHQIRRWWQASPNGKHRHGGGRATLVSWL